VAIIPPIIEESSEPGGGPAVTVSTRQAPNTELYDRFD
jgi:hypothetical protein